MSQRGTKIDPNGTETILTSAKATFSLEELQSAVGGFIERVRTSKPVRDMWINEEGYVNNLPPNAKATALISPTYRVSPGGVRGSVLVMDPRKSKS